MAEMLEGGESREIGGDKGHSRESQRELGSANESQKEQIRAEERIWKIKFKHL